MHELYTLALLTSVISATGALSPGPLTISTLLLGVRRGWRGGLLVALGHILVELPYVALLTYLWFLVRSILLTPPVRITMDLLCAGFLSYLALTAVRSTGEELTQLQLGYRFTSPLLTGIVFTGLNAHFLLWWLTAALPILRLCALNCTPLTFVIMYCSHVWLDLVWLPLVAEAGRRSALLLGVRTKYLLYGVTAVLLGLSTYLIADALWVLWRWRS